jgi:DNA-binding LacI/PurR family transcriptional regulator
MILSPYFQTLLNGLVNQATAMEQDLTFHTRLDVRDKESTLAHEIANGRTDGAIFLAPPKDVDSLRALVASGFPCVVIAQSTGYKVPHVHVDDTNGSALAMAHLYQRGHRKIAHMAGPLDHSDAVDRLASYGSFCRSHGLTIKDHWVQMGEFTFESGYRGGLRMVAEDRPTAIFAANDDMAMGCAIAVKDAGLEIPRDVSIVGFDDVPSAAQYYPPLTTIRQPIEVVAAAAVRTLVDRIEGLAVPDEQTFETELVIRASTAPPSPL